MMLDVTVCPVVVAEHESQFRARYVPVAVMESMVMLTVTYIVQDCEEVCTKK